MLMLCYSPRVKATAQNSGHNGRNISSTTQSTKLPCLHCSNSYQAPNTLMHKRQPPRKREPASWQVSYNSCATPRPASHTLVCTASSTAHKGDCQLAGPIQLLSCTTAVLNTTQHCPRHKPNKSTCTCTPRHVEFIIACSCKAVKRG